MRVTQRVHGRPGAGGAGGETPGRLFRLHGGAEPALAIWLCASAALPAQQYTHYAADPGRSGVVASAPARLSSVLWIAGEHPPGTPIRYEGASSPVVYQGRVYSNARHYSGASHVKNKLVALNAATGAVAFETLVDKATLDSWSSPAVDTAHNSIVLGSGSKLYAIDATTGGIVWACPLPRSIVNASPAVAEGLTPGRAFISDYDGFGDAASLYCVNTGAFDYMTNPYQPGEVVWQEPIGTASGSTPAYADGVVFAASIAFSDQNCEEVGAISAFDVGAPPGSRRLWTTCQPDGVFGGVNVSGGFVYAAGYDFVGASDNSTLAKIRCADGGMVWTVPCERTASIPIVEKDRIYLSGGISGFGSAPRLEAFQDLGASAVKLWDTNEGTSGALVAGGWTHQPLFSDGRMLIGAIPLTGSSTNPCTDLYVLDLSRSPGDAQFVIDHCGGVGSSPAVCAGRIYSIGTAGLYALARKGDYCGGDGVVNGLDIQCFVDAVRKASPTPQEIALGDFDGSGTLGVSDVPGFVLALLGS